MGNSKSRLRKDLLFLDTTDRVPVRAEEVVHTDKAAVEAKVVGVAAVRSRRPIAAVAASTVGIAVIVAAAAGSREKRLRDFVCICTCTAEPITWLAFFGSPRRMILTQLIQLSICRNTPPVWARIILCLHRIVLISGIP